MTWHEFIIIETSRNKHRGMTWLKYITIHTGINIGLQKIRNTSEYIPKLQLHQHSLLTRKVFTWHNLSALVFFSVSAGSSHLQVIFVFKSSSYWIHLHLQVIFIIGSGSSLNLDHHGTSSLDLDHHSIWIITGYHHWIWIITRSGSTSLDWIWIIPRSRSSLLDHHHWIWIITRSRSSLAIITGSGSSLVLSHDSSRHRKFYRASPFSCWL